MFLVANLIQIPAKPADNHNKNKKTCERSITGVHVWYIMLRKQHFNTMMVLAPNPFSTILCCPFDTDARLWEVRVQGVQEEGCPGHRGQAEAGAHVIT